MLRNFLVIFLVYASSLFSYNLSICAIFRDEADYLKEWIDFHISQGVEHFWLYNNLSKDHYLKVLDPYIKTGFVELIEWNIEHTSLQHWNEIQCAAYLDGLKKAKGKSKWVAFLDADEFLFNPEKRDLRSLLKDYDEHGGVVANWVMYGTSHVEKVPANQMLKYLVYRGPLDSVQAQAVKSIVQPKKVVNCINPHFMIYKKGSFAVSENFERVDGPFSSTTSVNKFRINHYWSRDLYFFYHNKIPKRERWGFDTQAWIDMEATMNEVFDPILADWKP